jgi:hypothetical protein
MAAFAVIGGQAHISSEKDVYLFSYAMAKQCNYLYGDGNILGESNEMQHGNVPVYTLKDSTKKAVSQEEIYMDRVHPDIYNSCINQFNDAQTAVNNILNMDDPNLPEPINKLNLINWRLQNSLKIMSPREFAACVNQRPHVMKKEEKEKIMKEMTNETQWGTERERGQGRQPSERFLFNANSPLFETHCLALNAKQLLVVSAGGKPPAYPVTIVPEGDTVPPPLKAERNKWGAYVVSNYWPWSRSEPPRIPPCKLWLQGKILTVDWDGFLVLCDYLYDTQASFVARGRRFEIKSLAYGTREHPEHGAEHKKLITVPIQ